MSAVGALRTQTLFVGQHNLKEVTTPLKTERWRAFRCLLLPLFININLNISDQPRQTVGGGQPGASMGILYKIET